MGLEEGEKEECMRRRRVSRRSMESIRRRKR